MSKAITLAEHCRRISTIGTGAAKRRGDAAYYSRIARLRWQAEKKKTAQVIERQ